jgi:predicted GTPase
MIVANKIDLEESSLFLDAIADRFPKQEIFPISAQHGDGLDALRERLCAMAGRPE